MLTGCTPSDRAVSTGASEPLPRIRRTEIWLLPASVASRKRPSALCCREPCEATGAPFPLPPAAKGDPGGGVRLPSALRSNPAIVLAPAVLSLTERWPTTGDACDPAGETVP